jgi:hypothetical protein
LLALETVPTRLGLEATVGPVDLAAGAVGAWYRATGAVARSGLRPGGWVALGVGLPLGRWVRPFVTVGADLYLERLELRSAGRPGLSAGALNPWAAIGVALLEGGP